MACPNCYCKVTYPVYDPEDYSGETEGMERCANCGYSFYTENAEDDEYDPRDEEPPEEE
jgi:hypothetical protein